MTFGSALVAAQYFDANPLTKMPRKTKEGVIIWRTFVAGGSTMVSCGNAMPSLVKELADYGIDLEEETDSVMADMPISLTDESMLSSGTLRIKEAAVELGYQMAGMPKFLRTDLCKNCGTCTLGCAFGARWTAKELLEDACEYGCEVKYGVKVREVLFEGQQAVGIIADSSEGEVVFNGETVVLSAGGLGSPVILQNSGIEEAGQELFMDLLINVYGIVPGVRQGNEPLMSMVLNQFHETEGFILSPYVNLSRLGRFIEMGPQGVALSPLNLLGLMVKTTDEMKGRVFPDGTISKDVTDADWKRLNAGYEIAKQILVQAGAEPEKIMRTKVQGAHPGGTARIGRVVDKDLQTRMENLFVCDASVFPKTPGLPPIITILALARRLAKHLRNL
jgi:choline dehydrogenase-like flavoprotein